MYWYLFKGEDKNTVHSFLEKTVASFKGQFKGNEYEEVIGCLNVFKQQEFNTNAFILYLVGSVTVHWKNNKRNQYLETDGMWIIIDESITEIHFVETKSYNEKNRAKIDCESQLKGFLKALGMKSTKFQTYDLQQTSCKNIVSCHATDLLKYQQKESSTGKNDHQNEDQTSDSDLSPRELFPNTDSKMDYQDNDKKLISEKTKPDINNQKTLENVGTKKKGKKKTDLKDQKKGKKRDEMVE